MSTHMKTPELPGLQCLALLNRSSGCVTWKAIQESLQREVDVKILQADSEALQTDHFLDISRTIAKLNHPHLAQVHDIVAEASGTYVVMEHVEGASLAELVAGTGPLKTSQALRLAEQLAEAVDHAWTHAQIVFRNLKPQNIRVNAQGILKVSEFGLAVRVVEGSDPTAVDHGNVVGTPHYISPEQARADATIDTRADMYAFGTILYFLMTGASPFEGKGHYEILQLQIDGQIPHPRALNAQIPMPVCHLIARLMMKAPADRPARWTDVLDDIKRLHANRDIARPPASYAGSTIASLVGVQTKKTQLRTVGVKPGAATPAETRKPKARRSHLGLWLLLGIWFLWVGNDRLDNPLGLPPSLRLPFRLPDINYVLSKLDAPSFGAEIEPVQEQSPATSLAQPPVMPLTTSAAPDTRPAPGGTDAIPASSTGLQTEQSTLPLDAGLLQELGNLLRRSEIAGAKDALAAHIKGSPKPDERLEAIGKALDALPDPISLVAKGLQATIGTEIVIRYLGRERTIIPKSIVDGELNAAFIDGEGNSRPVSFSIANLDADQKIRWLPEAQTPAEAAVHCILALQAGDTQRFQKHRNATGALAPLFGSVSP